VIVWAYQDDEYELGEQIRLLIDPPVKELLDNWNEDRFLYCISDRRKVDYSFL